MSEDVMTNDELWDIVNKQNGMLRKGKGKIVEQEKEIARLKKILDFMIDQITCPVWKKITSDCYDNEKCKKCIMSWLEQQIGEE